MLNPTPFGRHHEQGSAVVASEHAGETAPVELDPLQDFATFANTHAAFHRSAPDGPSASRQIPSGPSSRAAHTRRFDRLPSAAMSTAVSRQPKDSATINVELSGVTAMPLPNSMLSAISRTTRDE